MTSIKGTMGRRAMVGMAILAALGFLISAVCFLNGVGLETKSAIHQVYGQSLMINSALGFLIMTVAISAAMVVSAIRNAQAHNRKLWEGLRVVDPPAVVPSSTQQEVPQDGVPALKAIRG